MKLIVHSFTLSDVEDPELYAAGPIWDWQQSPPGIWVLEHCIKEPYFTTALDPYSYGYVIRIIADLENEDVTYYNLKWNNK